MGTITIPSADPTSFCRLCFSDINLLVVIRPDSADQLANQKLLQLVRTYLRLELLEADDFPSAICELCYALLQEFDQLYKNAQHHNDVLRVLIESESKRLSTPLQTDEYGDDTPETTPVEIFEPLTSTVDEIEMDAFLPGTSEDSNRFDGHILVEDVPYTETSCEEKEVRVFHFDGELQQFMILSNDGANNAVNGAAKKPTASQTKGANKPTAESRPWEREFFKNEICILSGKYSGNDQITSRNPAPLKTPGRRDNDTSTAPSKQLFRCNDCSSLFVELSNYHGHSCSKQQTNSRSSGSANPAKTVKYHCRLCNVAYRRELYWHKHQYEVHGISSEFFGISCNICQIQFSQRQDYRLHVFAMHPID